MDKSMNEWVNKWINICSQWQNKDWLKCRIAALHSQNNVGFWQTQCSNFNWLAEQEQGRERWDMHFATFPTVFLFWACQGSPLEIIYGKSSASPGRQGTEASGFWNISLCRLNHVACRESCCLRQVPSESDREEELKQRLVGRKMLCCPVAWEKQNTIMSWTNENIELFWFSLRQYPTNGFSFFFSLLN